MKGFPFTKQFLQVFHRTIFNLSDFSWSHSCLKTTPRIQGHQGVANPRCLGRRGDKNLRCPGLQGVENLQCPGSWGVFFLNVHWFFKKLQGNLPSSGTPEITNPWCLGYQESQIPVAGTLGSQESRVSRRPGSRVIYYDRLPCVLDSGESYQNFNNSTKFFKNCFMKYLIVPGWTVL